jgi:two-component system response regulator FixJ
MPNAKKLIFVVDDDQSVRDATARLIKRQGLDVACFDSGNALVDVDLSARPDCILLDVRMPGLNGIDVLRALRQRQDKTPVIMMSGHGDIPLAVEAMREGACDFLEKPYPPDTLIPAIDRAIEHGTATVSGPVSIDVGALDAIRNLPSRQRQVLGGILCGHSSKIIAYQLGLSTRTVETYRAQLLSRLGARNTSQAVKLALAAGFSAENLPAPAATDG